MPKVSQLYLKSMSSTFWFKSDLLSQNH